MGRLRLEFILPTVMVLALPLQAVAAQHVWSCVVGGRTVVGDTLPQECYGRAWVHRVNGTVVERAEAELSPEERKHRRELEQQRLLAEKESARQRQQDSALMERYPSIEVLDQRRDRELGELDLAIKEMRERERDFVADKKKLDDEVAGYKEKGVSTPANLAGIVRTQAENLARQRKTIARKVAERDQLRRHYDGERARYLEITTPATSVGRGR